MTFIRAFSRGLQVPLNYTNEVKPVDPTGSRTAAAIALTAAFLLITAAAAQNVAHSYEMGLHHSQFRAGVLAIASVGASLLGPFCFLAAGRALGRWRVGTAAVAFALGCGCLAYAGVCSLGFVSGARDLGTANRTVVSDARSDAAERFAAAKLELAGLATTKGRAALERRRELTKIMADAAAEKRAAGPAPAADSQASAVAFVLSAVGWRTDAATVGPWLNLAMVLYLELAASLSLLVASALAPVRSPPAAVPDNQPPTLPGREKAAHGDAPRSRTAVADAVVATVRANGGKVSGGARKIARAIGARKSTVHDAIVALAAAGVIERVGSDLILRS